MSARRAVAVVAVALAAVGGLTGCKDERLVTTAPDFCTTLIAGVADYRDFADAVVAGSAVTPAVRDVAASYVGALRASAPADPEVAAALATFTTPFEVDQKAQGQVDVAPDPIDAETLTAATAALLNACASA